MSARKSLPLAVQCSGTCAPTSSVSRSGHVRFDAVEVEHLRAVERGEVAGLADLRHQRGQHLVAQAAHDAVVQRVERQLAQRRADGEAALVGVARQEAAVQQLRAQAVRGGLGQAQAQRQLGQRQRAAFVGQQRQQAQAALGRRAAVGNGGLRGRRLGAGMGMVCGRGAL